MVLCLFIHDLQWSPNHFWWTPFEKGNLINDPLGPSNPRLANASEVFETATGCDFHQWRPGWIAKSMAKSSEKNSAETSTEKQQDQMISQGMRVIFHAIRLKEIPWVR